MKNLFGGIYKEQKVLITGHNGFKGSWLAQWLTMLDADVYGFALAPDSTPNHKDLLSTDIVEQIGDIRDAHQLEEYIQKINPTIVFHLAAQALVRKSYKNPQETFSTNVMGTFNVFEACRKCESVKAIINITSDKCYQNNEWIWGYRENDRMGGYDPYSASKGMSEILTSSFRNSFFNHQNYDIKHHVLLGSARAGNVIGGGDWAEDRLIPDLVKAANIGERVMVRNPLATRPWQHVLEPLSGYLCLGWQLLNKHKEYAQGWNFGPDQSHNLSVSEITQMATKIWPLIETFTSDNSSKFYEANLLMLDCSKANKLLKWKPIWSIDMTISKTINWYKEFYTHDKISTKSDILSYVSMAKQSKSIWTE